MSTEHEKENQNIDVEAQESQPVDETAVEAEQSTGTSTEEASTASLEEQLEEAQTKAAQNWDLLLRERAETQNIQRRADREVSNARKFALERICNDMLPVLDSLEQGLALPSSNEESKAILEGIELTVKMMVDALHKHGIEQLNPVGEVFNPEQHEAMVMQESAEHEPNTIMNVFQKGYMLNGRLIRPARVVVSKGDSPQVDTHA